MPSAKRLRLRKPPRRSHPKGPNRPTPIGPALTPPGPRLLSPPHTGARSLIHAFPLILPAHCPCRPRRPSSRTPPSRSSPQIRHRITFHGDEIGVLSGGDGPDPVLPASMLRAASMVAAWMACIGVIPYLTMYGSCRRSSVRVDAAVGAVGDPHPGSHRLPEPWRWASVVSCSCGGCSAGHPCRRPYARRCSRRCRCRPRARCPASS